jgi:peptidyl-prolyl cis-trans isomerase B (cyclophilin B)
VTTNPPPFPPTGPQPAPARRRTGLWIGILIGAIVLSLCVIGGTVGAIIIFSDHTPSPVPSAQPNAEAPSPSVEASPSGPDSHSDDCVYAQAGAPSKPVALPSPDPTLEGRTALATMVTSQGAITLSLDGQKAPCTVRSFLSLTRQSYFDNSSCHRLTTTSIFVLQCGDPTGTGGGGPGYQFGEENLPTAAAPNYPKGTVAMARTAQPGTNGSQFFIVYADTNLPADYTVFGTVSSGMDVLQRVAAGGSTPPGDGKPNIPVQITRMSAGPA